MAGDPTRRLAREIRAARAYSGKSRKQIAREIDLDDETVGRYERGEWTTRGPRRTVLQGIADATDIPQAWLNAGFLAPEPTPGTSVADAADRTLRRRRDEPGEGHGDPRSEGQEQ